MIEKPKKCIKTSDNTRRPIIPSITLHFMTSACLQEYDWHILVGPWSYTVSLINTDAVTVRVSVLSLLSFYCHYTD